MFIVALLLIIACDVMIHIFTIQHWGWLMTIYLNLGLMLTGFILYRIWNKFFNWYEWAMDRRQLSKKKIKKIRYQLKYSPEKVTETHKQSMHNDIKVVVISIGNLLLLLPGLFSGSIGLFMMILGFILLVKEPK